MTEITATYSPEDNKLRLYASSRLDSDTYAKVKAAGFRWAPKQELFVAPSWTPKREDLCIELAGEIGPEGTTLAERAEAKAERLDALAAKREHQSNLFAATARQIGSRFEMGQPILVGHHSERRARKDRERMDSAMRQSVKAAKAVDYWQYRAAGVEAHANSKAAPRTRANRIKKLLAELRDMQRRLNHAWLCLEIWEKLEAKEGEADFAEKVEHWAGAHLKSGSVAPYRSNNESYHSMLYKGEIKPITVVRECINYHEKQTRNPLIFRWIEHLLNRLGYERAEQGGVERFSGEMTATVLQGFAREQGADSPKAVKVSGGWTLKSPLPLPVHIGQDKELTLTDQEWRDLMEGAGHVPAAKTRSGSAALPLLNLDVETIQGKRWGNVIAYRIERISKADFAAINRDYKGVCVSICGQFRFRTMLRSGGLVGVYLLDSKAHDVPESIAITKKGESAA